LLNSWDFIYFLNDYKMMKIVAGFIKTGVDGVQEKE
jgi:hypothetical protein